MISKRRSSGSLWIPSHSIGNMNSILKRSNPTSFIHHHHPRSFIYLFHRSDLTALSCTLLTCSFTPQTDLGDLKRWSILRIFESDLFRFGVDRFKACDQFLVLDLTLSLMVSIDSIGVGSQDHHHHHHHQHSTDPTHNLSLMTLSKRLPALKKSKAGSELSFGLMAWLVESWITYGWCSEEWDLWIWWSDIFSSLVLWSGYWCVDGWECSREWLDCSSLSFLVKGDSNEIGSVEFMMIELWWWVPFTNQKFWNEDKKSKSLKEEDWHRGEIQSVFALSVSSFQDLGCLVLEFVWDDD